MALMLAPVEQAYALEISPSSVRIAVGADATVRVTDRDGTVRVSSANAAIATVTYASGVATIHGVSSGSTTVTIRDSENTRRVAVTVTSPLTVSPASVTVAAGGSAFVSIANASGEVRVSSANTAIATASYEDGRARIRGRAAGTTTVTIRDNDESRTVAVTVTGAAAGLTVSPASVSVAVGSTAAVSVTNISGPVALESANPAIATATYAAGVATIRGVSPGSTNVAIQDSDETRMIAVTVTAVASLTVSPASVSVVAGNTVPVSVTNASGTVTAVSANTAVATVTYASGVATIRGVAAGSTTVAIGDSDETRTVSVTVTPAASLTVSPSSVSVAVGSTAPVSVTNASGTVTAVSANTAIATVTYASGVATIRGVAAGSTTVAIGDSDETRTVSVTVTPAASLTVSPSSVSVAVGSTAPVSVTNASGTVTAVSANTAIATVTYASGVATIRGVAAGSTTVAIGDSDETRTVTVTVTPTAALTVSPTSVAVAVGATAAVSVSNASGAVTAVSSNTAIATVTYASGTATIRGVAAGTATVTISDGVTSRQVAVTVVAAVAGNYTLLAWNNLGMHCIDGVDYSVFSILPPLNTVNAQLKNKAGDLVSSGVTLTYTATPDTTGSINTISSTKTNFWTYVQSLFGLNPAPDVGLLGYPMASNTPAPMAFNSTENWWEAVGIPITNYDDTMAKNTYPMIQITARNTAGQTLATTKVVLPVSDMLDCRDCHSSNNGTNGAANAARPAAGWVFDPDPLKDWKKNILRLHDERQTGNATYASALQAKGYPNGLYNSALTGKPVLCVACHVSNAYQIEAGFPTGMAGIPPLTQAIHGRHAGVIDPANNMTLEDSNNRTACYNCHPGSVTKCLRGAMSGSETQCQSCHAKMSNVGAASRSGWLSMPTCQSCHHNSQRGASAVDANGNPLTTTDQTFATTPNVPSAGFSLYRFSTGHGGMKCSACHNSTHAEYPSIDANDNVQSIAVQGHPGTIFECTACHNPVPNTTSGGPHGMHTIGSAWVSNHRSVAESSSARAACAYCHGADFRGSVLSQVKMAKTVGSHTYAAGQAVTCYDCHNGPTGGALSNGKKLAATPQGFFDKLSLNAQELLSKLSNSIQAALGSK